MASDHLPVLIVFNNPFTYPFSVTSIQASNNSLSIIWESVPGQSYRVEASSTFASWEPVADHLLATNSILTWTSNLSGSPIFFRVKRID